MKRLIPPYLFILLLIPLSLLWAFHPETQRVRANVAQPWNIPLILGLGVLIWARMHFSRKNAEIHTFAKPNSLETDGPFRFSRNPMYLGFSLLLLAGAMYVNTWCAYLVPITFWLVAELWYIPYEEKTLRENFDTAYDDYVWKTRRWIQVPRPKIDSNEFAERIISEAEQLLVETSGRRLVLSEISARIGISQSYAHRFFPTKADLVRSLAHRWFETVEQASQIAAAASLPTETKLLEWVLSILSTKREKFDADPALFRAYLLLAEDHMDLVRAHTLALRSDMKAILGELVVPENLEAAAAIFEDATLLFRTPHNIARFRHMATDQRATAVVEALMPTLRQFGRARF